MYVSVQRAARRLGVAPVTIRRWTSTGFLPCTRTPGGHRRIATEDIDELARSIGEGDHLAARLARERELETVVSAAMALTSRLELPALLAEIAQHVTSVLDCHLCAISEWDRQDDSLRLLADYDNTGNRLADSGPYPLRRYPVTREVLEEKTTAVVYVDDPAGDPAEIAQLKIDEGKTLLMIPLVYQERTIGLLEAVDRLRRRRYTRQELRLARAIAGHAAVALVNVRVFEENRTRPGDAFREAASSLTAALPALGEATSLNEALAALARNVLVACRALSCVASAAGTSADAQATEWRPGNQREEEEPRCQVVAAHAADVSLIVTLPEEPAPGMRELIELAAAAAAAAIGPLRG